MKYRFSDKEKLLSFGRYPELGLADARLGVPGSKPLRTITSADVLAMIRSVEARGALDVSRRLKQHVSQVYRFAIPQGWAEVDPATYLAPLLKPKPRTRHMPRVALDELPQLVRTAPGLPEAPTPEKVEPV